MAPKMSLNLLAAGWARAARARIYVRELATAQIAQRYVSHDRRPILTSMTRQLLAIWRCSCTDGCRRPIQLPGGVQDHKMRPSRMDRKADVFPESIAGR